MIEPLGLLSSRDEVGTWLTRNGLTGEGVEIGVYDGGNAEIILKSWPGVLHLIDPWERQSVDDYAECRESDFDAVLQLATQRMAPFGARAIFHGTTSDRAFAEFTTNGTEPRFDFIYIDGNHQSPQVDRDLDQWWTLLKPGGLFGGHDYNLDSERYWHCKDVKPAVDGFMARHGLSLHITHEPWPPSWWTLKCAAMPASTPPPKVHQE